MIMNQENFMGHIRHNFSFQVNNLIKSFQMYYACIDYESEERCLCYRQLHDNKGHSAWCVSLSAHRLCTKCREAADRNDWLVTVNKPDVLRLLPSAGTQSELQFGSIKSGEGTSLYLLRHTSSQFSNHRGFIQTKDTVAIDNDYSFHQSCFENSKFQWISMWTLSSNFCNYKRKRAKKSWNYSWEEKSCW